MSLGAVGGSIASSVGKSFAKAGVLVGGALFIVRYQWNNWEIISYDCINLLIATKSCEYLSIGATSPFFLNMPKQSNNIVHFTMPHLFEGQEELLMAAEKEAERLAAKGTHFFDVNNDGQVNRKDFEL